ncbi:MAG: hypothetical protein HY002_14935 [Candidatus Rokubacteria bacterium]|nr:hypothetical protein [Candidatus Rokubacteria bacterium]
MRPRRAPGRCVAGAVAAALLAVAGWVIAQPAKPNYLPYAEFRSDDTPQSVALKRGYNETVQRYNQDLYDYHVTLEAHDRLVDIHNRSTDPAERRRARQDAQALRAKLNALRGDVMTRAAAVDEAVRRAAAGGVTITR